MDEKEKARELFDKMKFECEFNCQPSIVNMIAVRCAVIACDEHINELNNYSLEVLEDFNLKMDIDFYENVKEEIIKLL